MTIREDPEKNEIRALKQLADFSATHILEVGCGDGRLTWQYARETDGVIAIEPFEPSVQQARKNMPADLQDKVLVRHMAFEDFAQQSDPEVFDIVILPWSL